MTIANFDGAYFIQCLAETIAWCSLKSRTEDVKTSFRSVLSLPDETLNPIDPEEVIAEVADRVIATRRTLLENNHIKVSPSITANLAGGRLLIFARDSVFANDGVVQIESNGFFDYCGYPAWDTWVQYYSEKIDNKTVKYPAFHIISWIPSWLMPIVDEALKSNPDEAIFWLDKETSHLPYRATLEQTGLL